LAFSVFLSLTHVSLSLFLSISLLPCHLDWRIKLYVCSCIISRAVCVCVCVCVCLCVCPRVRACVPVHLYVCVGEIESERECVCVCVCLYLPPTLPRLK